MRVVIIGAGEVGTSIAANLSSDHDVVVIEEDETRAEQLKFELDVLAIAGDGTSLETQEDAGVDGADMFIACTDDDRTNLVACGTAKTLGEPFTIARVKSIEYLRTWERKHGAFGADHVVCSDLLTAENIVRVIGLPTAIDLDLFVGGLVHMAEFEVVEGSPVAGQTVAEADRFDSLTFAGLFCGDDLVIPDGETVIETGNRAVVIGSPESVRAFGTDIAPDDTTRQTNDVVIAGGTEIGYHTARLLEEQSTKPRLIEADEGRARELAEELPNSVVMQHDATDTDFLAREHVDESDVMIAAMNSDERNLLVAVLAKRLGVKRVIAVVDNTEYVTLFEEVGIDVAINPRDVTAEDITRFSFENVAENLAVLENDQAEVLELQIDADSALAGKTIRELDAELDGRFVVGAITREGSLITPRGDTEIRAGDKVVIFVESEFADELMAAA
ncbi:Trk system potassium transporter TrkA [Halovenus sp. WSH3]|uniref:Trk system potassium transporter TrkA n=1 Tax=Halovenus carboxidivorans TaxID=2692199 RepID=A0A6B0SZW7_9EURY|nr:Trk system potassium transporter TrkA [Halovenus carboxidivorans]MXR51095.1 Trk system potassium transporter TrkA [Halovenus carboxidivorans]